MGYKDVMKLSRDIASLCPPCEPENGKCPYGESGCYYVGVYFGAKKMYEELEEKNLIKE